MALRVAQIVGHHGAQLKTFAELETEDQIAKFTRDHALGVFLRRHRRRVFRVIPQPSARQNAAQVQPAAQLAARFVERVPHAQAAGLGMHIHVRAVKRVALRIVAREVAAVRDARPGVRTQRV